MIYLAFLAGLVIGVAVTISAADWQVLRKWPKTPRAEVTSEALLAKRVKQWKRERR